MARPIRSGAFSQACVEPSTSVNRNVTVPVGKDSGSSRPIADPFGTTMPRHGITALLRGGCDPQRDHRTRSETQTTTGLPIGADHGDVDPGVVEVEWRSS